VLRANLQRELSIADLGPDPLYGAQPTLARLVASVPAVVIAEMGHPGELKFEEILAPGATRASVFGYATYQATIREILYNRRNKMVPALNVASIVEIRQRVGREGAREFVARQLPVSAGDECLLFLWFQPHGWEILNWELVFRKSRVIPTAAESLGRSGSTEFVTNEWLGKSIPYARIDDVVMPDWNSLVSEIRRLGTQPAAP